MTREKLFFDKVCKTENCWNWNGYSTRKGYGQFWDGAKVIYAHRYSYEHFLGKIPEGLQVDHLCRNQGCVNPNHLEAVTLTENVRRGVGLTGPRPTSGECSFEGCTKKRIKYRTYKNTDYFRATCEPHRVKVNNSQQ